MRSRSARIAAIALAYAAAAKQGEAAPRRFPMESVAVEVHGAMAAGAPAFGAAVTFGGVFSLCGEWERQFRPESWGGGVHAPQLKDRFLMFMARLTFLPTNGVSPFVHVGVAQDEWRWDSGVTPPTPDWGDVPHLRVHESGSGTGSGPLIGAGLDIKIVPRLVAFAELRAALLMSNGELVLSGPGGFRVGVRIRLPR